jgi:hypothetical protein
MVKLKSMALKNNHEILRKYLPESSVILIIELLENNPCHLKIVKNRKTKHGDFRKYSNGDYQITINNDLNIYRFLLTLVHEIAHLVTYKKHKNIRPHGIEWKRNFQRLMLPFVNPEIYPKEILPILAKHLINPKASTDADVNLSLALKEYDKFRDKSFIFEIPIDSKFTHNNKIFIRGNKRRTRYECLEVLTDKKYLFHQNAEVDLVQNLSK